MCLAISPSTVFTSGRSCPFFDTGTNGRFSFEDTQGNKIHWDTVLKTSSQRVWLAEGLVRPGALLPPADLAKARADLEAKTAPSSGATFLD